MAKLLDWKNGEDQRDIVHLVVQALVEGHLVAVPTETAYHVMASALNVSASEKMNELVGEGKLDPPSLLLRSSEESFDYSPDMSRIARRAVYRGWPGPLVLELPTTSSASRGAQTQSEVSLVHRLPKVSQQLLITDDYLPQRVVPHALVAEAMRLVPGPMIAAPCLTNDSKPDALSSISRPADADARIGEDCTFLVDDGETHFGGSATRIRVNGNRCEIRNEGVIEADRRKRLFHCVILLVCTGNTCRSPMAEVLLKDLLQKAFPELASQFQDLIHVASGGLSAFPGGPASPEAQAVMQRRGLNLKNHQSCSVTEQSLRNADLVLTMTQGHRRAILENLPDLESKIHLLSGEHSDVSDPFGGPESLYAECADQIEQYLQRWVSKIDESWFPDWA